jgi:hypothetical protein
METFAWIGSAKTSFGQLWHQIIGERFSSLADDPTSEPACQENHAMTTAQTEWPRNAASYYRPTLFVALAASAGVVVGSIGPWVHILMFSVDGLDFGNWGVATSILGAASGIALFTALFWASTPFDSRWAVPVVWGVVVAGLACLTDAVINAQHTSSAHHPWGSRVAGRGVGQTESTRKRSSSPLPSRGLHQLAKHNWDPRPDGSKLSSRMPAVIS